MKDYLNSRVQTVRFKGVYSKYEIVKIGVPQGTILGPLLFIIYINDIFKIVDKPYLSAYADDTAIRVSGETWTDVQKNMNRVLKKVYLWLNNNQLTLNIGKTVYLTISCYSDTIPKTNINISINNEIIKRVDNCKYLGIYIDSCLRWDFHIKEIVKRVKYFQFLVYKLSLYMDRRVIKMLYHSLFESTIIYGIIAWGGAYKNSIKSLFNIQVRILNKIKIDSSCLLNIKQYFVYKSLINYYDFCLHKYRTYDGRSRHKIIQGPKVSKSKYCCSPLYTATKYFNTLPSDLKNVPKLTKAVKHKLKQWLITSHANLLFL